MKRDFKQGYIAGWSSIVVNIFLFGLKFWAGVATGSIAIVADAWHSLSDSLTSVIVIIGLRVSSKPADREHQYGHGRAELIASLIIGTLLAVIAFNFVVEGISRLVNLESVTYGAIAIAATLISILVKESQAQYSFWVGRKLDSKSIIADGWHHRTDAISSIVIMAGIFVSPYIWWIDSALAMMVAILIFYVAYSILKGSASSLLGERIEPALARRIKRISSEVYPKELQMHHLHIHDYGDHAELSLHIRLPHEMELQECHKIAKSIEKAIKDKLDIEVTIHVDPK